MDHAVRRCSDDQYPQAGHAEIPLMRETSIHAQQGIETLASLPKQLTVTDSRPACGLHGAGVVSRKLGGKVPWQILVKQNAHGSR